MLNHSTSTRQDRSKADRSILITSFFREASPPPFCVHLVPAVRVTVHVTERVATSVTGDFMVSYVGIEATEGVDTDAGDFSIRRVEAAVGSVVIAAVLRLG